ncbi:hypothetical protein NLJ89_g4654 [Agrocybe chaxingu]|uniref:Peroxin-3-domain-containing protein n=1 Tax=Agrocybe chaxingu TaxID=84603 RepID=A0A9W8MUD0_9AGAR|nr:hypothetical protein NLJ89_g4654 [Agrocybe chaxingu]
MFDYFKRHKATLLKGAGFVGGMYAARKYLRERLEEMKESMEVERAAKDSLRRRFQQSQEDTSFTVLALLATLSEQILQTMDVEALTKELQARSRVRNAVLAPVPTLPLRPPMQETPSSRPPSSSREEDTRSEVDSVAPSHTSDHANGPTSSQLSESFTSASGSVTQSWVQPSGSGSRDLHSPAPSVSVASSAPESLDENGNSNPERTGARPEPLSESIMSNLTSATNSSAVSDSSDARTKAELWNEVKLLTLTRTLTTLYSTTLLSLLTTLQLTLLARSKYVASVIHQAQEEHIREQLQEELSVTNLLINGMGLGGAGGAGVALERLLSGGPVDEEGTEEEDQLEALLRAETISEEVESKFLTMSWWLLHVGWKDVMERVRRGVEEVFEGVSLKTKLAAVDLHRLISDVRRRVEHEITFEGTEKRTDFLSSLLPSTPETIHLVLTQGGFTPSPSGNTLYPHDTIDSSPSLDSSQISYDIVNSPALAVSAHVTQYPHTSQHQLHVQSYVTAPPPPLAHLLDEPFASLMSETRSVLASRDFACVLEVCLDRATAVLFDGLEKNVFIPSGSIAGIGSGEEVRIRLAGLLPSLARWSQLALDGLPNELVDKILDLREVSCLSAIVFARFEEQF